MALDELRAKARLTDEQISANGGSLYDDANRWCSDAATDKAIKAMIEEFQAVESAGKDLINWLYENGLGGEYRTILSQALAAHDALQEEIDHD